MQILLIGRVDGYRRTTLLGISQWTPGHAVRCGRTIYTKVAIAELVLLSKSAGQNGCSSGQAPDYQEAHKEVQAPPV